MAPIPQKQKMNLQQPQQVTVSTDNVIDDYGRTLTTLHRKQKRLDQQQTEKTIIARQHASQGDDEVVSGKIIYRDIFPGRKYLLTFNSTSWLGSGASLQVGWTRPNEYHDVITPATEPIPDNQVEIDLTDPEVDYTGVESIEVRLYGAPEGVKGYLIDCTDTKSLLDAVTDLIENVIGGDNGLEARIAALEEAVGIPYTGTDTLDNRVTDLES